VSALQWGVRVGFYKLEKKQLFVFKMTTLCDFINRNKTITVEEEDYFRCDLQATKLRHLKQILSGNWVISPICDNCMIALEVRDDRYVKNGGQIFYSPIHP
jgi:hypothetical protein